MWVTMRGFLLLHLYCSIALLGYIVIFLYTWGTASHPSPVLVLNPPQHLPMDYHTSKGHVTWIIKKFNRIPTHYGLSYKSVHSLARGHVIRVWTASYLAGSPDFQSSGQSVCSKIRDQGNCASLPQLYFMHVCSRSNEDNQEGDH